MAQLKWRQTFIKKTLESEAETSTRLNVSMNDQYRDLIDGIIIATALVVLLVVLLSNKRYRLIYILYKTFPRDARAAYRFVQVFGTAFLQAKKGESVPKIFHKLALKQPQNVAYYFEDQSWTYQQLDEFSNRIAHYFKSQGYKKGDSVALLLENRPEYIGIWLGLSKIGVISALINNNLVSEPLIHSLSAANINALILGSSFTRVISEIRPNISHLKLYEFGNDEKEGSDSKNVSFEIKKQPITVPDEIWETSTNDKLIYIYTSGTTGMPKAAVIKNSRYMLAAGALYFLTNLSQNDILYNPLPLYHSTGGMLAASQALINGIPVVLRKKFSASSYWEDCRKYKCTVANYIGELCRYLLAAHKPGEEVEHGLLKMWGNGLRPQIWEKFRDTFKIKEIYEFYGATEGNSQLVNIDGTIGAVGFVPVLANLIFSSFLIKCDENTGEPLRTKEGLCVRCNTDEPGLLVAKINQNQPHKAFVGYVDEKATQKKFLRNVLVKGDSYFNTGDVLVQDEFGYFYFQDRTGDTYRWKGENVATCEVEAVISNILELRDVISYGVQIPNTEGRAGMAAVVDPDNSLDLRKLATELKYKLPRYAVPLFLRTMDSVPITGTFKLKKQELQREGYNMEIIKNDKLYFYNAKHEVYVPMTKEIYDDINNGKLL